MTKQKQSVLKQQRVFDCSSLTPSKATTTDQAPLVIKDRDTSVEKLNNSSMSKKTIANFKMRNTAGEINNWQNSSQDKILLDEKKKTGPKQTPPLQPGLRRFKTQTKEEAGNYKQMTSSSLAPLEEGLQTSSFAEDLSQNQAKIDVVLPESNSQTNKIGRFASTLGIVQNISMNDETSRFSDAGQKELSIVESDDQSHGMDTPTATVAHVNGGFTQKIPTRKSK